MLALTITDVKDFMNKLLIGDVFDRFFCVEATISTFNAFFIDGRLLPDFFDTDAAASLKESCTEYSLWRDLKPFCYSVIRGKRAPLSFKIVLQLSHRQARKLMKDSGLALSDNSVGSFYLNLQYRNSALVCTTGMSFSSFSLDKRPEQLWDETISSFFHRHQILFQKA